MPKRKYTKKSEYWNSFRRVAPEAPKPQEAVEPADSGRGIPCFPGVVQSIWFCE